MLLSIDFTKHIFFKELNTIFLDLGINLEYACIVVGTTGQLSSQIHMINHGLSFFAQVI